MADVPVRVGTGTFLRLKLLLLVNQLKGRPVQIIMVSLGALWLLGVGAAGALALLALRLEDVGIAGPVLVVVGSLLVLAWALLSLVLLSEDATMDPARFALLPVSRRRLATGLWAASCVGAAPLVTLVACLAAVVVWTRDPATTAIALACLPLAVTTPITAARAVTASAAGAVSGRRAREVMNVVLLIALTSSGLVFLVAGDIGQRLVENGFAVRLASAVGWTPLAAAWAAPWSAAEGDWAGAAGRFAVAVLTLALLWVWYERSVAARVRPAGGASGTQRAAGPSRPLGGRLARLLPDSPAGALAARVLVYWRNDPRYLASIVTIPVVALVLAVVSVQSGGGWAGLGIGPLTAAMLTLTMVNEFAYDGTAAWVGLAASVPGQADRAARHLVVAAVGVPAVVAAALVGTAVAERWDLAPALVGVSLTMLLVGLAVAAVVSVVWTYPVPEAGSNPFASSAGGTTTGLVQQAVAATVSGVLALPFLVLAVLAFWWPWAGWALLVAGPAWGAVCLWAGIRWGGRRLDARGPELLAALRR